VRPAFVLVGGSRSQLGLLEQARALGHEVCVVDGAETAPLLAAAEIGIVRNFVEVDAVLEDLRTRKVEPVAVATMGSDQAAFEGPSVLKPVDGSAQRGVTEVRSREEIPAAFERALAASRTGAVVLERYLEGDELTINGFLLDGEYFPMSITKRLLHPPPPLGVCIAHRYPSGLSVERERELFDLAHRASTAVGIETGPSYVQVREDFVIEVGARLGGGKDAELAKLVTGFDAVRANVLWALGELGAGDLQRGEAVASHGQVRFVVAPPGRIVRLDASPAVALDGVHEAGFYWREGMTLPPLISGAERLGYLVLTASGEDELDELTDRALQALDVEIAVEQPVG